MSKGKSRGRISNGRIIKVSPEFDFRLEEMTLNMNSFLQSKGQKERVYKTDMSDIYAKNVMVNIMPEDLVLIPTGRKGKRIKFNGEINI